MSLRKRPVTRLPYPLTSQLRYLAVAVLYRLLGWLFAPAFRRRITLADLANARILILKPCCLGDVAFATPLVRELRRALPSANLTFAVGTHSRAAIAGHPTIDALLDTGPVGSGRYDPMDFIRLFRAVRDGRFSACFVLERSALLAALPLLAGVPVRVGIDSGGRGFSLSVAVPVNPARPESELYLDLLRALGGRPSSGRLEFYPSKDAVERADRIVAERLPSDRPFVVLHCSGGTNPGMTLTRKRWPAASFRELARRIVDAGGTVVLVGAPDDRAVAGEILGAVTAGQEAPVFSATEIPHPLPPLPAAGEGTQGVMPPFRPFPLGMGEGVGDEGDPGPTPSPAASTSPTVNLVGALTLDELAALARRAAAYVGNDSGPSHLAEAAGANVVMLFGPSDPIVYGPRDRNAVALTAGLWCSPCFENGRVAPCANVLCMRSLSVERVWNEVARFMRERAR